MVTLPLTSHPSPPLSGHPNAKPDHNKISESSDAASTEAKDLNDQCLLEDKQRRTGKLLLDVDEDDDEARYVATFGLASCSSQHKLGYSGGSSSLHYSGKHQELAAVTKSICIIQTTLTLLASTLSKKELCKTPLSPSRIVPNCYTFMMAVNSHVQINGVYLPVPHEVEQKKSMGTPWFKWYPPTSTGSR